MRYFRCSDQYGDLMNWDKQKSRSSHTHYQMSFGQGIETRETLSKYLSFWKICPRIYDKKQVQCHQKSHLTWCRSRCTRMTCHLQSSKWTNAKIPLRTRYGRSPRTYHCDKEQCLQRKKMNQTKSLYQKMRPMSPTRIYHSHHR